MSDQYKLQNPVRQYVRPKFAKQPQKAPGLASKMKPKPDHGEETYRGSRRLEGRKAVITGADSGIGRATAIAFAREGADIVLNYLKSEESDAKEVADLIKAEGRKAILFPGDLTKKEVCIKLINKAVKELGGLDILANIAGKQVAVKDISNLTTDQVEQTFATNVYAMIWLCQAAMPHLSPGSTIINTASIQSYQPSPQLLDYASTKAAIVAFTKALAKQVAEKGIRVNAVAPGPIWTPLQPSGGQLQDAITEFGSQVPLGRPGQPAEVAPAYVFLASQESSYITAEVIGVTGGNHLP
jgi:NAD(P)-dependent dehydrogenase (short-subunit alcohol dehydrogenase family)